MNKSSREDKDEQEVSKEIRKGLMKKIKEKFCTLFRDKREDLTDGKKTSELKNPEKRKQDDTHCFYIVPGDHLLLFVGGTATAAQVPAGRGQEVETVVLKSLVCERKQHLERRNVAMRLKSQQSSVNSLIFQ